MRKRTLLLLGGLVVFAASCGGTEDTTDVGTPDDAAVAEGTQQEASGQDQDPPVPATAGEIKPVGDPVELDELFALSDVLLSIPYQERPEVDFNDVVRLFGAGFPDELPSPEGVRLNLFGYDVTTNADGSPGRSVSMSAIVEDSTRAEMVASYEANLAAQNWLIVNRSEPEGLDATSLLLEHVSGDPQIDLQISAGYETEVEIVWSTVPPSQAEDQMAQWFVGELAEAFPEGGTPVAVRFNASTLDDLTMEVRYDPELADPAAALRDHLATTDFTWDESDNLSHPTLGRGFVQALPDKITLSVSEPS